MKKKRSEVSTVIITNNDKNSTKTLQVKTKHISRFKHYVLSAVAVVVTLTSIVVYQHKRNAQQEAEKQILIAQITKLKGSIPAQVKTATTAQGYIQSIEGKLQKINDYLRKRGLPGFAAKKVGGAGNADAEKKLSDEEKYSAYNDYLTRLVKTVGNTPMGYPRLEGFSSIFGYRSDPFNSARAEYHPGIDFKGDKGDPVKCTANGKVISAGWYGGYGNCVRISHGNSLETLYGHLSHIDVKEGQQVVAGQVVGRVGSTGHSTGAHLHYEVRKDGKPVNPVKYLSLSN